MSAEEGGGGRNSSHLNVMHMYITFLIATVTLLIPTLLPMLRHEAWWVRCFDFPRLQLCE